MRFSVALMLLLALRAANREKHEDDQDIHPPDTEERAVMGPIPQIQCTIPAARRAGFSSSSAKPSYMRAAARKSALSFPLGTHAANVQRREA
jgi:hypothetical protein